MLCPGFIPYKILRLSVCCLGWGVCLIPLVVWIKLLSRVVNELWPRYSAVVIAWSGFSCRKQRTAPFTPLFRKGSFTLSTENEFMSSRSQHCTLRFVYFKALRQRDLVVILSCKLWTSKLFRRISASKCSLKWAISGSFANDFRYWQEEEANIKDKNALQ